LLLQQQLIFTSLVWRYLNMGIAVIPAAGGGVTQKVQEFTSTGSFVTPSNVTTVEVFLVAGGGAGGGANGAAGDSYASGGGGGGGVIQKTLTVTPGTTYTVTIGAGGVGGLGAGPNGGDTTFGALLTATGGGGGGTGKAANSSMLGLAGGSGGGGGAHDGGAGSVHRGGDGGGAGTPAFFQSGLGNGSSFESREFSKPGFPNSSSQGNPGGYGVFGGRVPYMQPVGGTGINGFAYGGAGGMVGDNNIGVVRGPVAGAHITGFTVAAGSSAAANTGNGGGGAGGNQNAGTANGGSGGSGYARVIYWS
jgi:hypothetical protein